jgi:hypothetical protein
MKIEVNHDEAQMISHLLRSEWEECDDLLDNSKHLEIPMPRPVYRALHARTRKAFELADRFSNQWIEPSNGS